MSWLCPSYDRLFVVLLIPAVLLNYFNSFRRHNQDMSWLCPSYDRLFAVLVTPGITELLQFIQAS